MSKVQFLMVLGFAGVMSLAGSFLAVNTLMGGKVNASPSIAVGGAGETVQASKFVLTDNDGNVRGLFVCDAEGDVTFSILDKKQNPRISQVLSGQEAAMVFTDRKLKKRMSMTAGGRDQPGAFAVYDSSDRPAALLAVAENNFPMVTLTREGEVCSLIGVNKDGQSMMTLCHPDGGNINMIAGKNIPSAIILTHPAKKTSLQLFAKEDGMAGIELDHNDKVRAQLMTETNGMGKILFADPDGSIVWQQKGK